MAEKCEVRIADFILNVHDTFTGNRESLKKALIKFYGSDNVELDVGSKVMVDGREVGTFIDSKGKPAAAKKAARRAKSPKKSRKPVGQSQTSANGDVTEGSNESEDQEKAQS